MLIKDIIAAGFFSGWISLVLVFFLFRLVYLPLKARREKRRKLLLFDRKIATVNKILAQMPRFLHHELTTGKLHLELDEEGALFLVQLIPVSKKRPQNTDWFCLESCKGQFSNDFYLRRDRIPCWAREKDVLGILRYIADILEGSPDMISFGLTMLNSTATLKLRRKIEIVETVGLQE